MSKIIASVVIVALVAMAVGTVSLAAESTVTATVTAQLVALSVSDGAVAYGTIATSASTVGTDTQTVTNTGNVAEDFDIKGQNSGNWTLAGTAGSAIYKHEFSTTATFPGTALTTTYATLASSVAASGTEDFDLQITVPTSNAGTNAQNVNVFVQASAS